MSPLTALKKFFSGSSSTKPSRRRAPSRRLGMESLEKRQLMAGDVQVGIVGNELVLRGDWQGNSVVVSEIGERFVRVQGFNNTTLNGKNQAFYAYNPSDTLKAFLNGGNDELLLATDAAAQTRTDFAKVTIDMGRGKDTVACWGVSVYGHSTIKLGSEWENDADSFAIGRNPFAAAGSAGSYGTAFWQGLTLTTGGGNDVARFADESLVLGRSTISMGRGNDSVFLDSLRIDNSVFYVDLGSDHDALANWGLVVNGGVVVIQPGEGFDTFYGHDWILNNGTFGGPRRPFERVV